MPELLDGIKERDFGRCPSLSLYIHIPFCIKKCSYCDFFSRPLGGTEAFIERIIEELKYFLGLISPDSVPTVFIGGGNPPLMGLGALQKLCESINAILPNRPREWTIESNPAQISPEFCRMIGESGVNRLSVGVQTLRDDQLSLLGRTGSREMTLHALDIISSNWTGKLNVDMLSGIPGQKIGTAETDVLEVLHFEPGHVSLYELTVEDNTDLQESIDSGRISALDHTLSARIYTAQRKILETNGYSRYEISNYALPGKESLHNLGYWQMNPYLGIGPSAGSTLPGNDGPVRLSARASLPDWNYKAERIGPEDFLFEHIMMGMRLAEGLERNRIKKIFGYPPDEYYPETAGRWNYRKFLSFHGKYFTLINGGIEYLNAFLRDILGEVPDKPINPVPDWGG